MKLLLTTIAAVILIWYGVVIPVFSRTEAEVSESQQSATPAEAKPVVKAPYISIISAAMRGDIEAVKQHLAAGTDVNAKDVLKWTPLYRATNKETAELLIAEGADVNTKGDLGETPLHSAARRHKELTELLIANGADVNAKDKFGQTPLDKAVLGKRKESEIANLLRKHGGKRGEELKAEVK